MQGFRKYRISMFAILLACLIAVAFILSNIQAIEKNQIREYRRLSQMVSQTVWNFVSRKQYDNLLDLMLILTKTSMIQYMALYVDGENVLQAGNPEPGGRFLPPGGLSGIQPGVMREIKQKSQYSIWIALPLNPAILRNPGFIHIVFPWNLFQSKQKNIFMAIGLIVVLLSIIIVIYNALEKIYGRLKQSEKNRSDMVLKITHDADKYLNWIQIALDLYPESYFGRGKAIKGRDLAVLGENIRVMQEGTILLIQLVQNLHNHENLSEGIIRPSLVEVDLLEMIRNVGRRFGMIMTKRDLRFQVQSSQQPCRVLADKFLLDQVIMNLLDNAFKYSRASGEVVVRVQAQNQQIKTLICDQGPGIKPEDWEKIFEPFVRLIPNVAGRGLGLANARGLIQLFAGELGIEESRAGEGTTFYFSLPAAGVTELAVH